MVGQRAAPIELARRKARRIALMLVAQGEPMDTVERALHTSGFHPALAYEAVRWARDRRHEFEEDDTDIATITETAVTESADEAPPILPAA